MSYDDYTRDDLLRLIAQQHDALDGLQERVAYLQMMADASGLVERAALKVWPVAIAHLVTGKAQSERIEPEEVRRCAIRCWAMAQVFAEAAGEVLSTSEARRKK